MLVGYFGLGALECSYEAAFRDIGCEVSHFDIAASVLRYCRLGKAGQLFNRFVPVEAWIRKANREMVLKVDRLHPDVLVVFGQNPVQAGAFAQLRAMSDLKTVLVWPDTLVNLGPTIIATLPLYDLVATYSRSTIPFFERLGARYVEWVPLGADPHMHTPPTGTAGFSCDVSFIGQWRPEREAVMSVILSSMTNANVKIWGPDWKRRSTDPAIRRAWQARSLHAREFARAVKLSKISLNIIDDTNYPSANMRFFEIPCAGGLQVCSPCPEMEDEFKNGETIFYYRSIPELPQLIRSLLANDALRMWVIKTAQQIVLKEHTYAVRAGQILELLEQAPATK